MLETIGLLTLVNGSVLATIGIWLITKSMLKRNAPTVTNTSLAPQATQSSPLLPLGHTPEYYDLPPVYVKWPQPLPPPLDAPPEWIRFASEQPQIEYPEEM
jgi:hypothetical protein